MEDLEGIVRKLHAQWRAVTGQVGQECDDRACKMFKGTENVEELAELLTSPQGEEFCLTHRFPNLATFRLFKPFSPERWGVYIDAGEITLIEPENVVLVGKTRAVLDCRTLTRHKVMLMHGATAVVNAAGWAVVAIKATTGCQVIRNVKDYAVIL